MSFPASLADRTAAFIRWSIGSAVAILILIAVQPAWWTNPIDSMIRFLSSNLTRDVTKPIAVLYWGNVYRFSLPWHNTLVLTAITMPVTLLILGAIGVGSGLRRRTPFDTRLWLCSWLVLMIVRALPGAPGHDGERLFLPSYASFFVLAGIGVHTLLATRLRWARAAGRILVAGAMIETGAGLIQLYPYTLSYYNCVVGSLRGAEKHGFELTYYYDTLGSEFFDYVRSGKAGAELRFPSDLVNTEYWRRWGFLPSNVRIVGLEPTSKPSYVLQRRRGLYYPYDDWLDRHGTPSFVLRRQGVELLKVFPFEESLRAYEATRLEAIPEHLRP